MSWTTGNKNGEIWLGWVKWDNQYNNVMLFNSVTARHNFMTSNLTKQNGNIIYINPDSYVDIQGKINNIEKVNYCFFKNDNDISNTYYFAFVTRYEYVANNTTRLYLTTDIFQQLFFNVSFQPSRIIRAHIPKSDDIIGRYIENEPYIGEQTVYSNMINFIDELRPYYVMHCLGALERQTIDPIVDKLVPLNEITGGVLTGACFGSGNIDNLNITLTSFANTHKIVGSSDERDQCQYIQIVPFFTAGATHVTGYIGDTLGKTYTAPQSTFKTFDYNTTTMINEYTPKNKKLFTSQYQSIEISSQNSTIYTFKPELLSTFSDIRVTLRGSCGGSGMYTVTLSDYNGSFNDKTKKVNYGGFVSLGFDANNSAEASNNRLVNILSTIVSTGGAIAAGVSGNAPLALGLGSVATSTLGNLQDVSQSFNANIKNVGSSSSVDDIGLGNYELNVNIKAVTTEFARKADEFLTAYGYALNMISNIRPFFNNRSNFNYIQTDSINCVIPAPTEWATEFRSIFNKGVRLWHNYNNFGNLGVSND